MQAVRPPKPERAHLEVPTYDQLIALLEAAKGKTWEIPVLLALATGPAARRSEAWRGPTSTWRRELRITRGLQRVEGTLVAQKRIGPGAR